MRKMPVCTKCGYSDDVAPSSNGEGFWCETCGFFKIPEAPTMRDQFAMAALTGLLASEARGAPSQLQMAEASFQIADCMLLVAKGGK